LTSTRPSDNINVKKLYTKEVEAMENRLSLLRKERGLTQQQLAEMAGVTRQTIIAIEAGKFNPSVILAFKLSKIFGLPIEEIFIYREEEANEL